MANKEKGSPPPSGEGSMDAYPCFPNEKQAALLFLLLIDAKQKERLTKGDERKISRLLISQNTVRRLCGSSQISPAFLIQVQENLLAAGWALFCIGSTHYAMISLDSVKGWTRISSKSINDDVTRVLRGTFAWRDHWHLFTNESRAGEDNGDETDEVDR